MERGGLGVIPFHIWLGGEYLVSMGQRRNSQFFQDMDSPLEARETPRSQARFDAAVGAAIGGLAPAAAMIGALFFFGDMRYVKKDDALIQHEAIKAAVDNESSERKSADSNHDREIALIEERSRKDRR